MSGMNVAIVIVAWTGTAGQKQRSGKGAGVTVDQKKGHPHSMYTP